MRHPARDRGFTLVEVLVALAVLAITAAGVASLFALAIRNARAAREQTTTVVLATEKVEELLALTWGYDALTAGSVSDFSTDLGRSPPDASGNGLAASPAGSLEVNTPGYVDYLDARGVWVGTGAAPPAAAVYLRRWHIEALPADPDTLILRVLASPIVRDVVAAPPGQPRSRRPDEALIVALKRRKAG